MLLPSPFTFLDGMTYTVALFALLFVATLAITVATRKEDPVLSNARDILGGLLVVVGLLALITTWVAVVVR